MAYAASLSVGQTAVQVPVVSSPIGAPLLFGLKLLGRAVNVGNVYVGMSNNVSTATGVLIPNGSAGSTFPYVVPAQHFASGGQVWLISDTSSQTVDWSVA
jgi:hypothetical protein